MKKAFAFVTVILSLATSAQKIDCGTPVPKTPLFVNKTAAAHQRMLYTSPLLMKVYVHVVANDNGTLRAVDDSMVLRQLENMQQLYAAHGICFILTGMEQLNSTDLNTMDASEEADLVPHLVPDVLNIFIHRTLTDGTQTLNGTAYNIPNTYVSLVDGAISSITNISTTAHEIGHAFGLYHTFETSNGTERIDRTGVCANCTTAGDLLCDTEADPHSDTYDTGNEIGTNCVYTGSITQTCNNTTQTYRMDPRNVMSYGRRSCHNRFTAGQGDRATAIITTNAALQDCIAPDNGNVSTSQTISSGRRIFAARNAIAVTATAFTVNNTARVSITSNNSVTLSPGVTLSPTGTNAFVSVIASTLCQ